MKRILLALVLLCSVFPLIAGISYQLDFVSLDPLHKEYMAYRDNASTSINYTYLLSGLPDYIYQDSKDYSNINISVIIVQV